MTCASLRLLLLRLVAAFALTSSGCALSHLAEPSALADGGTALDLSLSADAGLRDASVRRDAGPARSLTLGVTLSCGLDRGAVLAASVRRVACEPDTRFTVGAAVEAHEALLFGSWDPYADSTAGFAVTLGCDFYRCAAAARSCVELAACPRPGSCAAGTSSCEGDTLHACSGSGTFHDVDCGALGAHCIDGACALGDCRFGSDGAPFEDGLMCDGDDLVLCRGAVRLSCPAHRAGNTCGSIAVGGEVSVNACVPPDFGGAAVYSTPVDCDGRHIRFTTFAAGETSFDCIAAGYVGCDERGCLASDSPR